MKLNRPINLNLWRIKFPITAIVSILHRISGIVFFLAIPFLLYLLSHSLVSQVYFDQLNTMLLNSMLKYVWWLLLMAIIWHVFAGIRHLLMDYGVGESLPMARLSAWVVVIASILTGILLGFWLW